MVGGAAAISLPGGGGKQVDPCAAERAPIVEREKQYEGVRRSHLGQALGAGLKKGAMFFGSQMMSHYLPGIAGSTPGASGALTSLGLDPAALSQAGQLTIPGVTAPAGTGAFGAGNLGANDTRSIAALSVVVAIVSTVEAYVQLKEQEAGGDTIRLATSIDEDAGRQVEVNKAIAAEEAALSACRAHEVADYQSRLGGASNTDDRRTLARDRTALQGAIKKDVDLTGGVVDQQAGLAKTYTQGRAMAEGKSEADVLGGQAPAYAAAASTTPLKLPPPADGKTSAPAAPPSPPPPTWSTARAVTLRATASIKGASLASLPSGAAVDIQSDVSAPDGWSAVKAAGKMGYVRTAMLVKTQPAAPTLAPPSNIREHNKAVLAARDQGPNRLKTLLTDVQTMRGSGHSALAANGRAQPSMISRILLPRSSTAKGLVTICIPGSNWPLATTAFSA
jgi:hypothetical protein